MTEKIIIESHKQILHERVLLTMTTNVKSTYWTPTLEKLVKLIIVKDTTCLDKNNNIFQTTRFNHTMIFFKLTD